MVLVLASIARRIHAISRAPLPVSRMKNGGAAPRHRMKICIFIYIIYPLMMMSRRRPTVVVHLAVALLVWGFWRLLVALE